MDHRELDHRLPVRRWLLCRVVLVVLVLHEALAIQRRRNWVVRS